MSSREAKRLACSIASIWILSNLESGCLSNDVPGDDLELMMEELLDLEEAMHEISAELCRRGKNATGWHLVDMKGAARKLGLRDFENEFVPADGVADLVNRRK